MLLFFLAQNGKRAIALNGNKWQRTLRVLNGRAGFFYSMPLIAIECHSLPFSERKRTTAIKPPDLT